MKSLRRACLKQEQKVGNNNKKRSALIDISNVSLIVVLAMETPTSIIGEQRSSRAKNIR